MSPDAIAVATANLTGIGRNGRCVRLLEGSWFDPLPPELRGTIDVVISNPPYVAEHDELLDSGVADWEPHVALFAPADGFAAIAY